MRQLTDAEKENREDAWIEYITSNPQRESLNSMWGFNAGFIAGLEYQDKRIEALETIIKNALNEAYQSEVLDIQMESSLIGNAYADKQDWLDSRIEEWK